MRQNRSIDYIELPAADLAAVERFYGAVFAWTFEYYGDSYLAFKDHRMDGGFYKVDSEICSRQEAGAALVVFYSDSLDETQRLIEEAGGKVLQAIFDFPGGRRFHFADPHGNELAVWSDG